MAELFEDAASATQKGQNGCAVHAVQSVTRGSAEKSDKRSDKVRKTQLVHLAAGLRRPAVGRRLATDVGLLFVGLGELPTAPARRLDEVGGTWGGIGGRSIRIGELAAAFNVPLSGEVLLLDDAVRAVVQIERNAAGALIALEAWIGWLLVLLAWATHTVTLPRYLSCRTSAG